MCLSNITVHTGINSVVLVFYSKTACFVNVCTRKALNCYFFYFLLRILWLQLNLTALCHNQVYQERQNSSNYTDDDVEKVSTITLKFPYDGPESNLYKVQIAMPKWQNKVCGLRLWKEDPQSMQQGPVLQCNKTGMYQNQTIHYTCTFGNWSMCRNACDSTNDSGGLSSFFLIIITKISFDTIHECMFDSNVHVLVMTEVGRRSLLHMAFVCRAYVCTKEQCVRSWKHVKMYQLPVWGKHSWLLYARHLLTLLGY